VTSDVRVEKAQRFGKLHDGSKLLALPNVWEVAGARIFEEAGFEAIGTTSRGVAASMGYPDGEAMSRDEMLEVVARIVNGVSIPVSADMEAGYGETPEEVAKTGAGVLSAGAVGINIEDGRNIVGERKSAELRDQSLQIEKIQALREVASSEGVPLVINARTDAYWLEVGDPAKRLDLAIDRGNAYRQAGADCVFVPGVTDAETIAKLVQGIDGPINILAVKDSPSLPELQDLGVARVSVGSGPYRATLALLTAIGNELKQVGTYTSFTESALRYGELIHALTREGEEHIDYPSE